MGFLKVLTSVKGVTRNLLLLKKKINVINGLRAVLTTPGKTLFVYSFETLSIYMGFHNPINVLNVFSVSYFFSEN